MIAVLAPAMRMVQRVIPEAGCLSIPSHLDKTARIAEQMRTYEIDELSRILKVKEEQAVTYYLYWQDFIATPQDDPAQVTPAAAAYSGIAYTYLDAASLSAEQWDRAQDRLRIICAPYGVLKPKDGVMPYRLEMKSPVACEGAKNLYAFWGSEVAQHLEADAKGLIINLTSSEYSKAFLPFVSDDTRVLTMDFKILCKDGYKTQSTWAKISRGKMARMIIEQRIEDPEDLKSYDFAGFAYNPELSSKDTWVFLADDPTLPEDTEDK